MVPNCNETKTNIHQFCAECWAKVSSPLRTMIRETRDDINPHVYQCKRYRAIAWIMREGKMLWLAKEYSIKSVKEYLQAGKWTEAERIVGEQFARIMADLAAQLEIVTMPMC